MNKKFVLSNIKQFLKIFFVLSDMNMCDILQSVKTVKKIKQSPYRAGKVLRVPGCWSFQVSNGNVVIPTYRQPLLPENIPETHFC